VVERVLKKHSQVKVHKGPWVHRCQNEPRRSKP